MLSLSVPLIIRETSGSLELQDMSLRTKDYNRLNSLSLIPESKPSKSRKTVDLNFKSKSRLTFSNKPNNISNFTCNFNNISFRIILFVNIYSEFIVRTLSLILFASVFSGDKYYFSLPVLILIFCLLQKTKNVN